MLNPRQTRFMLAGLVLAAVSNVMLAFMWGFRPASLIVGIFVFGVAVWLYRTERASGPQEIVDTYLEDVVEREETE